MYAARAAMCRGGSTAKNVPRKRDAGGRYSDACAYVPPFAPLHGGHVRLSCARRDERQRCDSTATVAVRQTKPASTVTCARRRSVLPASTPCGPRVTAGSTAVTSAERSDWRSRHSSVCSASRWAPAAASARRRAAPLTGRWQSPAWTNGHHACPRERDGSLRERTRRPASRVTCQHAYPHGLVAAFLFPA